MIEKSFILLATPHLAWPGLGPGLAEPSRPFPPPTYSGFNLS